MEAIELIGRGGRVRLAAGLPQMLAAGGFDQPVDGVVGVLGARLDALVAEEDGLVRVVADVDNVARRIVSVVQVLQATLFSLGRHLGGSDRRRRWLRILTILREARASPGVEVDQPKRLRVVGVAGAYAVLVLDAQTLTLGVIVDVVHTDR